MLRTMLLLSLLTGRIAFLSINKGAVQRPRKPGLSLSYTSLCRVPGRKVRVGHKGVGGWADDEGSCEDCHEGACDMPCTVLPCGVWRGGGLPVSTPQYVNSR